MSLYVADIADIKAVADAIRAKTGDGGITMTMKQMPAKIAAITTGDERITEKVTLFGGCIYFGGFGEFYDQQDFGDRFNGAIAVVTYQTGYEEIYAMFPAGGIQEIHNYYTASQTIGVSQVADVVLSNGQVCWAIDPEQTFHSISVISVTYWRN